MCLLLWMHFWVGDKYIKLKIKNIRYVHTCAVWSHLYARCVFFSSLFSVTFGFFISPMCEWNRIILVHQHYSNILWYLTYELLVHTISGKGLINLSDKITATISISHQQFKLSTRKIEIQDILLCKIWLELQNGYKIPLELPLPSISLSSTGFFRAEIPKCVE